MDDRFMARRMGIPVIPITLEEAVRLGMGAGLEEAAFALKLARAVLKEMPAYMKGSEYGICFYAGIIAGQRMERARKKKQGRK